MSAPRTHRAAERRAWRAAAIGVFVCAVAVYAAFVRQSPVSRHYEVSVLFASANQLRSGNPVRVSGIDVGHVVGIDAGPGATTRVRLRLDDPSAVREDATFSIRPRLLFEGNFAVDVSPGRPGSPRLPRDATVAVGQTRLPVQLDQVLDILDLPTRHSVQNTVHELAEGLGGDVSGAEHLRDAVDELGRTADDVTRVTDAARGTTPGDARRAVQGSAAVAAQLADDPDALADLITGARRVTGALADNDRQLAAGVRAFASLGRTAPGDLAQITTALPTARRFLTDLRPALTRAPRSLAATDDLLLALQRLTAQERLPALLRHTGPLAVDLAPLQQQLLQTFAHLQPISDCLTSNVIPALNLVVPDGKLSTGDPAWLDLMHMGATMAGSSPNFDGNGTTFRLGVGAGSSSVAGRLSGIGDVVGNFDMTGVRPAWLGYGVDPPLHPEADCRTQQLPNLAARNKAASPFRRTARKGARLDSTESAIARLLLQPGLVGAGRDRAVDRLYRLLGIAPPVRRPAAPARPKPAAKVPGLTVPRPDTATSKPADAIKQTVAAPVQSLLDKVAGLLHPPEDRP